MKQCERCKMKFKDVLHYIEHKNTFKHEWKPMDPAVKDIIVARVEARLQPFLLGHGVNVALIVPKKKPIEIIIERFDAPPERFMAPHDTLVGVVTPNWVG